MTRNAPVSAIAPGFDQPQRRRAQTPVRIVVTTIVSATAMP